MPGIDITEISKVGRNLPVPVLDNTLGALGARAGRYFEKYVMSMVPTKHLLADEGSYFVATNPTIGTGVQHALITAFTDTSAMFAIKNNDQQPNGKRIYLDYIRLIATAAPGTAIVSEEFAIKLDTKDRTPTANNVNITPANTNMDSGNQSIANVVAYNAGALTVPASGLVARTVARAHIPSSLVIVGDEILLQFGAVDLSPGVVGLAAVRATTASPARFVENCAPVVIGPQQWAVIYRWALTEATTADSFEYEIGFWER